MSIAVDERGAGPRTVLLVHGLGSRGVDLAAVADGLAGFRCLLPDLRGHGHSPARPVAALADYAGDLVALARAQPEPVAVAGFSLGAWVALELWRAAPDTVSAIALVDPPLDRAPLERWAAAGPGGEAGARDRMLALYREHDPGRARALMAEHPLTRDLDGEALERNVAALLAADRDGMLSTLRLLRGWSPPARPAGSPARALVLHGTRSPVTPRPAVEALATRLGAEAATYDGGHAAHLSAPAEVAAALRRALA